MRQCIILPVLVGLLASGPVRSAPSAGQASAAAAVALVNGKPIARSEFGNALVRSLGRRTIDGVIERMLVRQEARKRGVTVSEDELKARREIEASLRLRNYVRQARLSPAEFGTAARSLGLKPEELRARITGFISEEALRVKLLIEKLLKDRVEMTPEQVRRYFERTRGTRFLAAHILVPDRETARSVLEKLRGDPGRWTDLLIRHTRDRISVAYRGRLPIVPASSDLGKALQGLEPRDVTIYQSSDGWHVVRLLSRVKGTGQELDQVRERVRRELLCRRVAWIRNEWLAGVLSRADVVTNLSAEPRERAVLGKDVAAYVNGEPLRLTEFRETLVREFGAATIGAFIERELIFQAAAAKGIEAPPAEIDRRTGERAQFLLVERASSFKMKPEQFTEFLRKNGVEPAEFREQLAGEYVSTEDVRAAILAEKAVMEGVQASEDELKEAYERQKKERFVVRELVADWAGRASRLYERIRTGADFRALVRLESAQPAAWLHGGIVRDIAPGHPYYKHLEGKGLGDLAYFKLEDGYHIVRVVGKKPPAELPSYESVRDSILRKVRKQKARRRIVAWLEKLRAEAKIEVNL